MGSSEVTAAPSPDPRRGSDYAELLARVRRAGLLDRRPAYYTWRIVLAVLLLVTGWTAFVLIGDSWWQLVTAGFLAAAFTQLGFLGHEAGHGQTFRSRRANRVLGLLFGNLAIGMSYGWWVDKHHRTTPAPTRGQRPRHLPAPSFTARQARAGGAPRWLARYQASCSSRCCYWRRATSRWRASGRSRPGHRSEPGGSAARAPRCLRGIVSLCCRRSRPWRSSGEQGLFGLYLGARSPRTTRGCRFQPDDRPTSCGARCSPPATSVAAWVVDFALGGLNYQIEHHLFPSMPRPAMRSARPIVRAYCVELGIPYIETSLFASYRHVLSYLHTVGRTTAQR